MGHQIAVISGHNFPHVVGTEFPPNYVAGNFQYTSPWKERQIPNSWFSSPDANQVLSSQEVSGNLLQKVSGVDGSELFIDTSTWSANDQQNFDPAQQYGSTDISTTLSVTTPPKEDETAHNPILLTDENSATPTCVQPADFPATFERFRTIRNVNQNLPEYVVRTRFEEI